MRELNRKDLTCKAGTEWPSNRGQKCDLIFYIHALFCQAKIMFPKTPDQFRRGYRRWFYKPFSILQAAVNCSFRSSPWSLGQDLCVWDNQPHGACIKLGSLSPLGWTLCLHEFQLLTWVNRNRSRKQRGKTVSVWSKQKSKVIATVRRKQEKIRLARVLKALHSSKAM